MGCWNQKYANWNALQQRKSYTRKEYPIVKIWQGE